MKMLEKIVCWPLSVSTLRLLSCIGATFHWIRNRPEESCCPHRSLQSVGPQSLGGTKSSIASRRCDRMRFSPIHDLSRPSRCFPGRRQLCPTKMKLFRGPVLLRSGTKEAAAHPATHEALDWQAGSGNPIVKLQATLGLSVCFAYSRRKNRPSLFGTCLRKA